MSAKHTPGQSAQSEALEDLEMMRKAIEKAATK